MTVTVNLPQKVEQAYLAAARTRGVSLDVLVADVLVSHAPTATAPEMTVELGVPVLRTGEPIEAGMVSLRMDAVRRERDLSVLGLD